MSPEEQQIIIEHLPEDFLWEQVNYTRMGNFSQLLYNEELIGYIMEEDGVPFFKAKGLRK